MIELYNEIGHIKNVLEYGIENKKYVRDTTLLSRYYKEEGIKKQEALDRIAEKVNTYCNRFSVDGKGKIQISRQTKSIVNSVYANKNVAKLREITEIKIPKSALDWFLGLEDNFIISDDKVKEIRAKVKRCGLRVEKISNYPITMNRAKMLFTFYVWYKIEQNYIEYEKMKDGRVYSMKQCHIQYKRSGCFKAGTNVQDEIAIMIDLGLLKRVTGKRGNLIIPVFIVDNKEELLNDDGKEMIVIDGKIPMESDLYLPGYYFEKKKMGSFICQHCGKEFAHYNKTPREMGRKYCKECAKVVGFGITGATKEKFKTIKCSECGRDVVVPTRGNTVKMCPTCRREHIKKIRSEINRRYYEKTIIKTE